jgi:hypothetical protein
MNQQWVNDDFPRNFDAIILDETPYEEPTYFSDDLNIRGRDGVYVKFRLSGQEWTGRFPFGMPGYPVTTGLVSCPDPHCVLVLSGGTAYYINIILRECREIDVFPAVGVTTSREFGILCIVGHDRLACIDAHGVRWRSGSVVPDDLAVERIDSDRIFLRGFDPMIQDVIRVSVCTQSGALMNRKLLGDLEGQAGMR